MRPTLVGRTPDRIREVVAPEGELIIQSVSFEIRVTCNLNEGRIILPLYNAYVDVI